MKTYMDCLPCFVRQAMEYSKLISNNPKSIEAAMREAFAILAEIDFTQTPPETARDFYTQIRNLFCGIDPYKEYKKQFNKFALEHLSLLEDILEKSDDKMETAILLSIAGNIIDMGVGHQISDEKIKETLRTTLTHHIDPKTLSNFKADIEKANKILFLGDNSGEIAIDKLLASLLPKEKVIYAVRGYPIINDATMEDAIEVGMTELVKVIDNGHDAPGTVLNRCSDNFRKEFEQADVIISKGQGNFETLSEVDANIYFILKVKCPVVGSHLNSEVGKSIFINQKDLPKI